MYKFMPTLSSDLTIHYIKKLWILNILILFVKLIYAIRARIAYMNYTKKLRIFDILNFFCAVYVGYSIMHRYINTG